MVLKVWGRGSAANAQKVLWCLGELGVPFEHHEAGVKEALVITWLRRPDLSHPPKGDLRRESPRSCHEWAPEQRPSSRPQVPPLSPTGTPRGRAICGTAPINRGQFG